MFVFDIGYGFRLAYINISLECLLRGTYYHLRVEHSTRVALFGE